MLDREEIPERAKRGPLFATNSFVINSRFSKAGYDDPLFMLVRRFLSVGLPLIYALAVYFATRPPKPVYTLANKTVITVTDK